MSIFGNLERLIDNIYPYRWPIAVFIVMALSLLATVAYRRRWHDRLWRHKLRTALVVVPLLIVAVPLSYYLLSPLWERTTIREESPLAASGTTVPGIPAPTRTPDMQLVTETPTTSPIPPTAMREPSATTKSESITTSEPTAEPIQEPTMEPTPEPFVPRLVSTGLLSGADDFHFASGTALVIETAPDVYVLRLEEFSIRNGPDLFVYLAADTGNLDDTGLNLGALRATDGSINYDIPAGTDVTPFTSVVIWCRAFAVLFGTASLVAS